MKIVTKKTYKFVVGFNEFTTREPGFEHEAPDWIESDSMFGVVKGMGDLIVLEDKVTIPVTVEIPVELVLEETPEDTTKKRK